MYVSYLNSFYMDVAAWLFLSIAAMFYLRLLRGGAGLDGVCFVACCAMAITSNQRRYPARGRLDSSSNATIPASIGA